MSRPQPTAPLLALGCCLALGCARASGPPAYANTVQPADWSYPQPASPASPVAWSGPGPAPASKGRTGTASNSNTNYCSASFQAQFGWPDPQKASRVCRCESSGNPRAVSANGLYRGLFQFSSEAWSSLGGGDVFDPYANSHHARRLYARRGWRPWPHCGRR